ETGQVYAGAENAPAAIIGTIDLAAAHHRDLGQRIENRDVDRDLHVVERRLILGVQMARIGGEEKGRRAAALDPRGAEIDRALGDESLKMLLRFAAGQQHGLAKMQSAPFAAENM